MASGTAAPQPTTGGIDLNADLGEGIGDDAAMLGVVTSASIACGGHTGDARSMRLACAQARDRDVVVGAHPSYADPEHFGRRRLALAPGTLLGQLLGQVRALEEAALAVGSSVAYLKPHGALYHAAGDDDAVAHVVLTVARSALDRPLPVLGLPGTRLAALAPHAEVTFVAEGFADRATTADGRLRSRSEPGAVLTDARQIADHTPGLVASAASICVHGDTPGAVSLAHAARRALERAGLELRPFA